MTLLLAFDFDHTIVDANTDTAIYKLSPNGDIPSEVKLPYKKGQWTAYMNAVFQYLHAECDATKDRYEEVLRMLPLTAYMVEIFQFIRQHQANIDFIIISDSNTWFIDIVLSQHNAKDLPIKVFTNEALFRDDGMLQMTPYHIHDHDICPYNLCKGRVMQEFIAERQLAGVSYSNIVYVGDGTNDYCPATTLSDKDMLFARKGFSLHKKLMKLENDVLKCEVKTWESGVEILPSLKKILES
uniref:pyridoxal phosphate phosphatase PHOSPHO2-like n=1 Tax=Styela clava TaxID=7725 RepID=UPI00193ABF59|nr:pyridoxal phosphate phosphatase PHOSPHO2-like [Styela clava]